MRDLNQQLMKFNYDQNFQDDDFYISKSNEHIYNLIKQWPNWDKKFLNISGEKSSGKTHLINIFIKKFKGIKIDAKLFNNENFEKIKKFQNIILEDLSNNINEKLIYTLINNVEQEKKYLIITTNEPIVDIKFRIKDLKSRFKNFNLQRLYGPDDELMFALILKNLSDRQIYLDKKLINFIIKRIERSYSNISDFIYKIDEMSLKKKKINQLNNC